MMSVTTATLSASVDVDHPSVAMLLAARRQEQQIAHLPEAGRPADNEAGLQIQHLISEQLLGQGETIAGWKCASPAGGKLIAAPIYRSKIHSAVERAARFQAPQTANNNAATVLIEPELALVLNTSLSPRAAPFAEEEIRAAVGEIRLALEIIGSRYVDPAKVSFPELLADGLLNSGLVLGAQVSTGLQAIPEKLELTISSDGDKDIDPQIIQGAHPEVDVFRPLYWLVNFLRERGIALHAGQAIITGSYAGVLSFASGATHHIQYGSLGRISFTVV